MINVFAHHILEIKVDFDDDKDERKTLVSIYINPI